jgi:hypothetical protein
VEEIEGDNSEGSDSDSQSEENETSDTGSNSTDSTDDISSDSSSSSDPDEIIAPPVLAAPLRMPLGIGETIVQLSLTSAASNVPRAVRDGLAEKTRADHIAIIKAVAAAVKPQWRQLPLANAAVKALERLLTECRLPTLAEIVQLVNEGEYAVCWDFAQYFHAFEYAEAVRKFLGLEFRGKYYRLRRMAMGQTHSCDIAQFVSELILEHILAQIPGTKGVVHIDNGLVVVRSREQGEQVIELLLATAATLGITINDATMLVPSQVVEFVGLNLDFKTSTVSLGPKVLSKAAHLRDYLATVTTAPLPTKLVSCVMGVALFGHAVAREAGDYPAARHYCSMSFYRRLSKDAALAPEVWDRATVIPEQVTADMINWLDEMLRNPQRQRVNDAAEADTYVFVDASATAWAVVLCEASQPQRAIVRTGSYPPDVDTERSTQTEPYGLSQALRIIGQIGGTKAIALATDHEPLVSATRKGMSSNARYNRSILDLAATTPRPRILHIAGEMNPADEPSRGMPLAASKLRNAIHMVRNGTNSPALAGGEILPKTSSDHAE